MTASPRTSRNIVIRQARPSDASAIHRLMCKVEFGNYDPVQDGEGEDEETEQQYTARWEAIWRARIEYEMLSSSTAVSDVADSAVVGVVDAPKPSFNRILVATILLKKKTTLERGDDDDQKDEEEEVVIGFIRGGTDRLANRGTPRETTIVRLRNANDGEDNIVIPPRFVRNKCRSWMPPELMFHQEGCASLYADLIIEGDEAGRAKKVLAAHRSSQQKSAPPDDDVPSSSSAMGALSAIGIDPAFLVRWRALLGRVPVLAAQPPTSRVDCPVTRCGKTSEVEGKEKSVVYDVEVLHLIVSPSFQGRGVGPLLLNAFRNELLLNAAASRTDNSFGNIVLTTTITNTRACKFYTERAGMKPIACYRNGAKEYEDVTVMFADALLPPL